MFPTSNNFSQFTRSQLAPFIDKQPLAQFKAQAIPISGGMTEDEEPQLAEFDKSGENVGGGAGGGVSSIGGFGGGSGGGSSAFSYARKRNLHGHEKIIDVNYGHNGSGKTYSYKVLGLKEGQSVRVGSIVTVMVTHYKSGRTFLTMGVVRRSRRVKDELNDSDMDRAGVMSRAEADSLDAMYSLKIVGSNDVGRFMVKRNAAGRIVQRRATHMPQSRLKGWNKHNTDKKGQSRSLQQTASAWWRNSNQRMWASAQRGDRRALAEVNRRLRS